MLQIEFVYSLLRLTSLHKFDLDISIRDCDNKNAVVWIKDKGDMKLSGYKVPLEEIKIN